MAWKPNPTQHKGSQVVLAFVLIGVLCVVFGIALLVRSTLQESTDEQIRPIIPTQNSQPESVAPLEPDPVVPIYDSVALQSTVDTWISNQTGVASVVISDPVSGTILASYNADQSYFAASIYKLYVAYEGYRAVDLGELDVAQDYSNGNTLSECLDIMIRESDSPCAEKLWAELGKTELNEILELYGLTGTDMVSLRTTAADVAIILGRIATGEGISEASQGALLASMQNQVFRDALNKGFSGTITVYNKIGFNELVEYHDTAIIELENGERLVVTVMTERVGTTQIAALGTAIEAALSQVTTVD